jgi:hypothetical protein
MRPAALLVLPAASFLLAAAIGSGACSSSVTLTSEAAPLGITYPPSVNIGDPCEGAVYFADGGGYVYCVNGLWEFTLDDPGSDDYTVDTSDVSFVDSRDSGESDGNNESSEESDSRESSSSEESASSEDSKESSSESP